ncbi:MAG: hypothetical protein Q9187_003552 [Circinaria calcarea]
MVLSTFSLRKEYDQLLEITDGLLSDDCPLSEFEDWAIPIDDCLLRMKLWGQAIGVEQDSLEQILRDENLAFTIHEMMQDSMLQLREIELVSSKGNELMDLKFPNPRYVNDIIRSSASIRSISLFYRIDQAIEQLLVLTDKLTSTVYLFEAFLAHRQGKSLLQEHERTISKDSPGEAFPSINAHPDILRLQFGNNFPLDSAMTTHPLPQYSIQNHPVSYNTSPFTRCMNPSRFAPGLQMADLPTLQQWYSESSSTYDPTISPISVPSQIKHDRLAATKPATKPYLRVIGEDTVPGVGTCYIYEDGIYVKKITGGEMFHEQRGVTKAGKARKRLAIACIACREKKIRCEPGDSKCVQCDTSGKECHYPGMSQDEAQPATGRPRNIDSSMLPYRYKDSEPSPRISSSPSRDNHNIFHTSSVVTRDSATTNKSLIDNTGSGTKVSNSEETALEDAAARAVRNPELRLLSVQGRSTEGVL